MQLWYLVHIILTSTRLQGARSNNRLWCLLHFNFKLTLLLIIIFSPQYHICIHVLTYTYSCSSSLSFSDQVLTLRASLLLNQYAAAMLVALGQPGGRGRGAQASGGIPLPETQQLVNHLVLDPLSSPRGHGSMILVRSALGIKA